MNVFKVHSGIVQISFVIRIEDAALKKNFYRYYNGHSKCIDDFKAISDFQFDTCSLVDKTKKIFKFNASSSMSGLTRADNDALSSLLVIEK